MITIIVPANKEKNNLERLVPILKGFKDDVSCEIVITLSSENSDGFEPLLNTLGVTF